MKKSRLGLFKSTSMLISVLGVIMVIATIIVVAYIGFSVVSSGLTGGVSSGAQYDELNELRSNYSDLESRFNELKSELYVKGNASEQQKFVDAEVYLVHAKNALDDVDSALSMGKDSSEVDKRLTEARTSLQEAQKAYQSIS
ncbi:MAG: hypothetical protein MJ203_01995 [archaeon]|nr:hypothetical protein [archaeon]